MRSLQDLARIEVPAPRPDEDYETTHLDRRFTFAGLKRLLGAADHDKSGDRNARVAATTELEREAARSILSSLTLRHIHDRPLVDDAGQVDSVMRVNYAIDRERFEVLAPMTVGELKDHLLQASGEDMKRIGLALTGVMVAAVTKLLDTHELIYLARKIRCPTRARTTLGLPGTLSSRLQPNHPTDDLSGIGLLVAIGLSLGAGDALIGVNPAVDTVENVWAILGHLDRIRRRLGVPTQICVLGHVKTQLTCLERGAPVEILFQSIAGTESTNLAGFDITVDLLDRAYLSMAERGPLRDEACQFMYFETGQGSELTYGRNNGIDMATTEALCYGLARRYDPFMVNNVTGFIGPETHLDSFEMIVSNLQDHFMGKLLGLPMGMAPCYTLHSRITLDGQQMATQMLAAAGANYYMDVYLNTDRMLAYFDTSGHDDQTLREIYARRPAPEYLAWAVDRGIFATTPQGDVERGPAWGDPRPLVDRERELTGLLESTPAMYGLGRAGPRPANAVSRRLRLDQAWAREAIHGDLDMALLQRIAPFRLVSTAAPDRGAHLGSSDAGSRLSAESLGALTREESEVQIVVCDGLSAGAVNHNIADLYPVLAEGLAARGLTMGQPIVARLARVKLAEALAQVLGTELVVLLIGERPGGDALASRSLSAYLVYQLTDPAAQREAALATGNPSIRFEVTVVSNIHAGGLPAVEAGTVIVEKAAEILACKAAGNRLASMRKSTGR